MLEGLLADILNRILGDYVENLDGNQLSVGVWGGDVQLNNLEIKETALDGLDFPVKLKFGSLDTLILKIPWTNLYTEAVIASIEGCYIVVVPSRAVPHNREKAEKIEFENKQRALARLEENRKKKRKTKQAAQDDTFTEKLVAQIIKNLQIKIKNIHVRYEDKFTDGSRPFAAGITLESLDFETTDESWNATIHKETLKIFYKLMHLNNLAVYWNSFATLITDSENPKKVREELLKTIFAYNNRPPNHIYVLEPIMMKAHLKLNQRPEADGSNWAIPKIDLSVDLERLVLCLTRHQYKDALNFKEALDRFTLSARFLKYRPNLNVYRGHYREWWHFAFNAILNEYIRRKRSNWSWERIRKHRQLVKEYRQAWIRKLTERHLPIGDTTILAEAERSLDLFNLNIARQQAELEIDHRELVRLEDKQEQGWADWARSWWYGDSKPQKPAVDTNGDIISQFERAMKPEEKAKLYEAIDYQENMPPTDYPKTFVERRVRAKANKISLRLEESLELQFSRIVSVFEQRPSALAMSLRNSVKSLSAVGCEKTMFETLNGRMEWFSGMKNEAEMLHDHDRAQDASLTIDTVHFKLSPTVSYLYSILSDGFLGSQETGTQRSTSRRILPSYEGYWEPQPFNHRDYWWFKEVIKNRIESFNLNKEVPNLPVVFERFEFAVDKFKITVESESNNIALPMILFESSVKGSAKDWTEKLSVDALMNLQMSYYNETFSVWEPVIEPVQRELDKWNKWEITAKIRSHDEKEVAEGTSGDRSVMMPKMTIDLDATERLDITLTKTFIQVSNKIMRAFQKAMSQGKGSCSLKVRQLPGTGSYLVLNQTGIPINVRNTDMFKFSKMEQSLDAHRGAFLSFSFVGTESSTPIDDSGHHLTELVLQIFGAEHTIDVHRAETRCISLSRHGEFEWHMVIDTEIVNSRRVITLKSVVQFINHTNIPLEIFTCIESDSYNSCGVVQANDEPLYIPLNLLYTATGEFFVKPIGNRYSMSMDGYSWHVFDNQSRQILCCNENSDSLHGLYIDFVVTAEEILSEKGKRIPTRKMYTVHAYPPLQFRNLLPVDINLTEPIQATVTPGQDIPLNAIAEQEINFWVGHGDEFKGTLKLKHHHEDLEIITLSSEDSELNLGIHFGTDYLRRECSVYVPYWIVNNTGKKISYIDSILVPKSSLKKLTSCSKTSGVCRSSKIKYEIEHEPNDNPVLMPFPTRHFQTKKKACVAVEDSYWSDDFPLDTVGNSGRIVCKDKHDHEYELSVDVKLCNSRLTKIVTFTAFYLLQNNGRFAVEIKEYGCNNTWIEIPPETCMPFWPMQRSVRKMACLRYVGQQEESVLFPFTENFDEFCPVNNKYLGFYVVCTITESSSIINIDSFQPGMTSALLINDTDLPVNFVQKGLPMTASFTLLPKHRQHFNFIDFSQKERTIAWASGDDTGTISLLVDNLVEYTPLEDRIYYYWVSFLNGRQRTLLFTQELPVATVAKEAYEVERMDQQIELNLYGIGLSLVNNTIGQEILYACISNSDVTWQQKVRTRFRPFIVKNVEVIEAAYQQWLDRGKKDEFVEVGDVKINFSRMVLCRKKEGKSEVKIRRSFQNGLYLMYRRSVHQTQVHVKLNHLQIDNQLSACIYPRTLVIVPPPRSVVADNEPKPFAEFSFVMNQSEHSNILQIKYLHLLVQEFDVRLDKGLVEAVLALFDSSQISVPYTSEMFKADLEMARPKIYEHITTTKASKQKSFYHDLHISPLMMHLSFSQGGIARRRGQDPSTAASQAGHRFFSSAKTFAKSLGVTATEVQNVVFKLAYFEVKHTFYNKRQLEDEILAHYKKQFIKQLYVLVFGLEILGNPYGLAVDLAGSVQTFFYQPFQGAIQGPEEFAEGLEIGLVTLFSNGIGGITGAASRITGTVGKGIAILTLDEEFQRKRQLALNRQPQNFTESMARGVEGFGLGIYDGVTGVVKKPIEGARRGGLTGFAAGVGRGAVGVVARPLSGLFDLTSNTFSAVKNIATNVKPPQTLRPTRYIQPDRIIRPYSFNEACGYKIFRNTDKGSYTDTENFIVHGFVDENTVFIVTSRRVLLSTRNSLTGSWSSEWNYEFNEIKPPIVLHKYIQLTPKEKKKTLFGLNKGNGKIIGFKDERTAGTIHAKLMGAYQSGG